MREVALLRFCPLYFIPLLELSRLRNFKLTPVHMLHTPNMFIVKAVPRSGPKTNTHRYFLRSVVQCYERNNHVEEWAVELERLLITCMAAFQDVSALEQKDKHSVASSSGHHFLIVMLANDKASANITPQKLRSTTSALYMKFGGKLGALSVQRIEIRVVKRSTNNLVSVPLRVVMGNPTGQAQICRVYAERIDPTSGISIYQPIRMSDRISPNHIKLPLDVDDYAFRPCLNVHRLLTPDDERRAVARKFNTVYARDFIQLFEAALQKLWSYAEDEGSSRACKDKFDESRTPMAKVMTGTPEKLLEAYEYHLNSSNAFVRVEPGDERPECAVLCWELLLRTPEFPQGRRIILLCNDITHMRGSFGVKEDTIFLKATEMAMRKGIPRIFISVNSGARMGVAQEVLDCYRVEWLDEKNPNKGFQYLYLTPEDNARLQHVSVVTEKINHPTKGDIYLIKGIVGSTTGIGVENLAGSGVIAGITAKAYNEIVTYTYVTGITVGIGAYLTRLGHRVLQKKSGAPILLTGYQALNKLIGKEVYRSNEEIGGPRVMYHNGISNDVVNSDFEGVERLLRLLSYVPDTKQGPIPMSIHALNDSIDRPLENMDKDIYDDPRACLNGVYKVDNDVDNEEVSRPGSPTCRFNVGNKLEIGRETSWVGGLFDKGTWMESMKGWAPSAIAGRARLGGIPVGVIAVETRMTESTILADPAMPESSEQKLVRAGQVWYPDSAYKTAQAINDFGREELPLFILANWRGFSGGQRDMSFEVLKFGSMIVEALIKYTHPIFVYIPPRSELRGGAWVVVDTRINPEYMEMYVDPTCRGGILEASGTVEIKYREASLRATCSRLDPEYAQLLMKDKQFNVDGIPIDHPDRRDVQDCLRKRFKDIIGSYLQAAHTFCDLHDKHYRMEAHGVIDGVVPWKDARKFFYWRLRRQLVVHELRADVQAVIESEGYLERMEFRYKDSRDNKTTAMFDLNYNSAIMARYVVDEWLGCNGYAKDYVNVVTLACHASNVDWKAHIIKNMIKVDGSESLSAQNTEKRQQVPPARSFSKENIFNVCRTD